MAPHVDCVHVPVSGQLLASPLTRVLHDDTLYLVQAQLRSVRGVLAAHVDALQHIDAGKIPALRKALIDSGDIHANTTRVNLGMLVHPRRCPMHVGPGSSLHSCLPFLCSQVDGCAGG